jgi:hypothetical protein
MKMLLKFTLAGIVGLVLLGVIAFYVDYYYYSWTSFVQPFGCRYKEIGYSEVSLEQKYDLLELAENMNSNPKYNLHYDSVTKSSLSVSRIFNDVSYTIQFSSYNLPGRGYNKVSFSNTLTIDIDTSSIKQSETSITPNYYIIKNISRMIDEMPLTDIQKEELKNNVVVRCWSGVRFP